MTVFVLGDTEFRLNLEQQRYASLRRKYQRLAREAQGDFQRSFETQFRNLDEVHEKFAPVAFGYLAKIVEEAVSDLVESEIFDIDDELFSRRYLPDRRQWAGGFEEVDAQYLAIVLEADELEALRRERAQQSGNIIGGGFGIEGAARGMVIAGAANMLIGLAHRSVDAAGRALSSVGDQRKKTQIFSNPDTKRKPSESVYRLILGVHNGLVEAMNQNRTNPLVMPVSVHESEKSASITHNISKGRIPAEKARKMLAEAIRLDPFQPKAYLLWLELYGDGQGQIGKIAAYFDVEEVAKRKRELIRKRRAAIDCSTPEECHASLQLLADYAKTLSFDIETEKAELLSIADQLDKARRSFGGTVYATEAEAVAAKADWEDRRKRTYDGMLYPTAAEAEQAKKAQDDLDERTFRGTLFDTIEAASVAKRTSEASEHKSWQEDVLVAIAALVAPFPNALLTWTRPWSAPLRVGAHLWMLIWLYAGLTGYSFGAYVIWGFFVFVAHGLIRLGMHKTYKDAIQVEMTAPEADSGSASG